MIDGVLSVKAGPAQSSTFQDVKKGMSEMSMAWGKRRKSTETRDAFVWGARKVAKIPGCCRKTKTQRIKAVLDSAGSYDTEEAAEPLTSAIDTLVVVLEGSRLCQKP